MLPCLFLSGILADLQTTAPLPRLKHRRPCGWCSSWLFYFCSFRTDFAALRFFSVLWCLLDPLCLWFVPVVSQNTVFQPRGSCSPRPRWQPPVRLGCTNSGHCGVAGSTKCGLLNVGSLGNKTFFMSRGLDFRCVTEMYLSSPVLLFLLSVGVDWGGWTTVFRNNCSCHYFELSLSELHALIQSIINMRCIKINSRICWSDSIEV